MNPELLAIEERTIHILKTPCLEDEHSWRIRGTSVFLAYRTEIVVDMHVESDEIEGGIRRVISVNRMNPDFNYQVYCSKCGLLSRDREKDNILV